MKKYLTSVSHLVKVETYHSDIFFVVYDYEATVKYIKDNGDSIALAIHLLFSDRNKSKPQDAWFADFHEHASCAVVLYTVYDKNAGVGWSEEFQFTKMVVDNFINEGKQLRMINDRDDARVDDVVRYIRTRKMEATEEDINTILEVCKFVPLLSIIDYP